MSHSSVAGRHVRSRDSSGTAGRLLRRLERRDDSGQTIVIVVVLLVLLALLAPFMARQVTADAPLFNSSTNKHAALAAAEAGLQWYRDNLDSYTAYYNYTSANNPTNDAALSGWCGAGLSSTCDLGGTNPAEAFHYVPNASGLTSQPGGEVGSVVLTVTGRAGSPGSYAYVYAQASFNPSSVLGDAYYSNFEVLDPNSLTVQGINVTSTGNVTTPETQYNISYSYVNSSGTTITTPTESAWQAACQYDTYSPNTFIDSLGLTIGGTTYSNTHPYYGPYQSNSSFSFKTNAAGLVTSSGATTVTVPSYPCEVPYDFVSGETFTGPVYTNDQLHVCGSPTLNGSPVSLTSGAPSDVPYLYNVPGSVLVTASNSGANGPYPTSLIGEYVPAGYTVDNVNCGGSGDNPTLAHGLALNGSQSLPSLNTALASYGTTSPPTGTTGTGCTYVGPTMIELVTSGSTTTMDVWSPLSTNTTVTTSTCSNGSTFSAASPLITGIALPTDGVVYVQNYTLPSGNPAPVVNDGATPCFNPYQYAQPADSAECLEGDAYVEGELRGDLTVASAANIIVTRDLTYQCADGSGGASSTDPSSVSLCTTENNPDVIGLSAKYDILVSHNDSSVNIENTQDCINHGFGDGTGTPANVKGGTFGGTVINGTYYANDPAAVWPSVCDPTNIVIDAAVFGLNGSFGVENWDTSPYSQYVNLNGTDLSEYRGPFGISGSDGYEKNFSYDSRLAFLAPPYVIPGSVPLWLVQDYVVCPSTSCPPT